MKAPNKIYVEVCEDGIFAFPEPPFKESVEYIRADLVDSLQKNQPEVELEKEIERFLNSEESTSHINAGGYDVVFKDTVKIARHFYELGRKGGGE